MKNKNADKIYNSEMQFLKTVLNLQSIAFPNKIKTDYEENNTANQTLRTFMKNIIKQNTEGNIFGKIPSFVLEGNVPFYTVLACCFVFYYSFWKYSAWNNILDFGYRLFSVNAQSECFSILFVTNSLVYLGQFFFGQFQQQFWNNM